MSFCSPKKSDFARLTPPSHQTHVGASGILANAQNEVLLGRRELIDESLPGQWCSPGGGVEFQETLEEAIVREFSEEVGLLVTVSTRFQSIQERITPGKHTLMVFKQVLIRGITTMPRALDGFDEVRWWSADEIVRVGQTGSQIITSMTLEALKEFFHYRRFARANFPGKLNVLNQSSV